MPILGIGLGITTGRARLVAQSLLVVTAGAVVVVLLGILIAQVVPNPTDVLANSQVLGRTSPRLVDLTAALAPVWSVPSPSPDAMSATFCPAWRSPSLSCRRWPCSVSASVPVRPRSHSAPSSCSPPM